MAGSVRGTPACLFHMKKSVILAVCDGLLEHRVLIKFRPQGGLVIKVWTKVLGGVLGRGQDVEGYAGTFDIGRVKGR